MNNNEGGGQRTGINLTGEEAIVESLERYSAHAVHNLALGDSFTFPYTPAAGNPSAQLLGGLVGATVGSNVDYAPPETAGEPQSPSAQSMQSYPILETDAGLAPIGNGHKLVPDAASAYLLMRKQALADGVRWNVCSSFRTLAVQVRLFRQTGGVWDDTRKLVIKKGNGYAATPGRSPHQRGTAVDVRELTRSATGTRQGSFNGIIYDWLFDNGWKWGWINPLRLRDGGGVDEAWHWEYHPELVGIKQTRVRR